jgi:hypothetical protein
MIHFSPLLLHPAKETLKHKDSPIHTLTLTPLSLLRPPPTPSTPPTPPSSLPSLYLQGNLKIKSALKRPVDRDHTTVEVARAGGGGGWQGAGGKGHGAPSFVAQVAAQATTHGVEDDLDLQLLLGELNPVN